MNKGKKHILKPPAVIGVVGGGQLGRMLSMEAKRMGYEITVLDPKPCSPASQVSDRQIVAAYDDSAAIKSLAEASDVITYEFEHINAEALIKLEGEGHNIIPSGGTLKNIQNKYNQKLMLKDAGLPVPEMWKVSSCEEAEEVADMQGFPLVLKSCYGGYDGKGNAVIRDRSGIRASVNSLACRDFYIEQYVDFTKELSILIAADTNGNCVFYPVVENVHEENILRLTKVPADIEDSIREEAINIARSVVEVLDDAGIFCIEMFLDRSGRLYINEIAPRPHNSGHYTIEACVTSQYEQLARILTGMPLGSTRLISPCVMANILGDPADTAAGSYTIQGMEYALEKENVYVHLYGKDTTARLKKLGHITVLADNMKDAEKLASEVLSHISVLRN